MRGNAQRIEQNLLSERCAVIGSLQRAQRLSARAAARAALSRTARLARQEASAQTSEQYRPLPPTR
jgi:hypothetical protein